MSQYNKLTPEEGNVMVNKGDDEIKITNSKKAYLAGGCFWGMEEPFRKQSEILN